MRRGGGFGFGSLIIRPANLAPVLPPLFLLLYLFSLIFFLFFVTLSFFLVREDVCEWKNLFWFEEASEVSKGVRNNS